MHQKKLEAELQQIEEKFAHKKRKFIEASDQFKEEMKKKCSQKAVDPNTYQKMVEKALDQLKKEHQAREEQQTKTPEKTDTTETSSQESRTFAVTEQHNTASSEPVSASEDSQEPIEKDNINNQMEARDKESDTSVTTDSNSAHASGEVGLTAPDQTHKQRATQESNKESCDAQIDTPKEESTSSDTQ